MGTRKEASSVEATPICRICKWFCGMSPSFEEDAPIAWCNPPGENMARPCMPFENARNKPCYTGS